MVYDDLKEVPTKQLDGAPVIDDVVTAELMNKIEALETPDEPRVDPLADDVDDSRLSCERSLAMSPEVLSAGRWRRPEHVLRRLDEDVVGVLRDDLVDDGLVAVPVILCQRR